MQQPGPAQQVQIAHIATEYYLNGKTRIEIAASTGLSRFKVGRLLEDAVSAGIVRFQIASPSGVRLDLSIKLKERFGLDHAVVVDVPSQTEVALQDALGRTAADLLSEILTEDDVLGLTSGRTLNAMAKSLDSLPCRPVVQMAGAAGPILQSGLEVMRRFSVLDGVRPWAIYSSLVMSDAQAAAGVRRQPDVKATFEQFDKITVAVGSIGSWSPLNSLMFENHALSTAERTDLLGKGVVAELAATLVTDSGSVVHEIDDRCIAISEQQLRAIPTVIGVAGGATKTRAIRAVLTAGLLTGLVTDSASAERLLGV
jgi:DNA-binding transcriptional regulator LsrR (DeoR family)